MWRKCWKDLGIDVTVGGFLGKDNQDGFQQLFSELGIANRFQVVQGRTRINVKLTERWRSDRFQLLRL